MEPENALEHMASIDLIELCNEAKIEHCRATRDLSSCGRYVQHVLNSCGHASLCAECSQRCDVCPICRTFLPTTGSKSRLRLYYKCIEAGLISKRYDDRFQEKKEGGEHSVADIQRLYSLFDVALENNLVSLICHYVTDVCMDESAVSSDPVLAFLLDEVVVKDWCKKKFRKIILDLRGIYILKTETMKTKLEMLQKFVSQLTGIASVLEVMDTSFREAVSAQLRDLHQLLENTLKTKQHLEVMIWCIQNQFLEGVQSRYPNSASWNILVCERKSAAVKRSWPDVTSNLAAPEASLFIEQALSNLGIEQSCNQDIEEELDISCLKDNNSPVLFLSKIDEWNTSRREGCYPFGNLRVATDVLFLHGTSDMVVAKQAIFLYYLFDRQWTRPDSEWRYLVDDFAAFFGITRHSLLESLAFYLLDDNSDLTLQEASILLPEIACAETHPKIAQVLLERQRPDVALTVLRCTGRDGCGYANSEPFSLVEAVTAVRVKIECGLLTEAFMYQRMHCSKMKEHNIKHGPFTASSDSSTSDSWKNHVEVLVSEICHLCSRRNLVDRIIELPWNSDEEKYILKCLYDYACQDPCTVHGSLLVVFYLQRYRYTEAYQVDRKLQILEQNNMETANEEVATRIKSMSHWRTALVDKSINLLPDVERKQVMKGNAMDSGLFSLHNVRPPLNEDLSSEPQKHAALPSSSSMKSPLILQKNLHSFVTKKASPNAHTNLSSPTGGPTSELGSKGPSVIQQRLLNTSGSPSSYQINTLAGRISSSNSNSREHSPSNGTLSKHLRQQDGVGKGYQSVGLSLPTSSRFVLQSTPQKEANNSKSRVLENANLFQGEQSLFQMEPNDFAGPADTFHSYLTRVNPEASKDLIKTPHSNGFFKNSLRDQSSTIAGKRMLNRSSTNVPSEEGNMSSTSSLLQKGSPAEEQDMKGLSRWRSDESSDDEEEDHGLQNYRAGRTPFMIPRGTKHTWR